MGSSGNGAGVGLDGGGEGEFGKRKNKRNDDQITIGAVVAEIVFLMVE